MKEFLVELYDRLPKSILFFTEPVIKGLKTVIYFLSEMRVPVYTIKTSCNHNGSPITILFIGKKEQHNSIRGFIGSRQCAFDRNTSLYFWEIKHYLNRKRIDADLTMINVNRILYYFVRPKGYLLIPDSVRSILYLDGPLNVIENKYSSNALRKSRAIKRSQYICKVHKNEEELKHFYNEMYIPYIRGRYGERAVIESYEKARRLMRTGFLLEVQRDDRIISGVICRIRNGMFVFELVGVKSGSPQLLKEGALDALYHYSVRLALEKKCKMIDFGISRPFLNDGLVGYKRKWGTRLIQNKKQCRVIALKIVNPNENGYRFFVNNYPVFFNNGGLAGLVAIDTEDPIDLKYYKHIQKAYFNDGLSYMYVLSPQGFSKDVDEHQRHNSSGTIELMSVSTRDSFKKLFFNG